MYQLGPGRKMLHSREFNIGNCYAGDGSAESMGNPEIGKVGNLYLP